jgi:hypothetical protein
MSNSIDSAINFLIRRNYPIPPEILALKSGKSSAEMKSIYEYIKSSIKADNSYPAVRSKMWAGVYDQIYLYLTSKQNTTNFKNAAAAAISAGYIYASESAWIDGGGTLPLDDDTLAWAKGELNAQLSYIDSLFENLKKLRKEGDFDAIKEAYARADGYASSLDGYYNYIKASAYGGRMLTFVGSDGRESCHDCKKLKSQRKRASWWVSHDYVPPSRNFECKGYNCDHYLIDDAGNIFTI